MNLTVTGIGTASPAYSIAQKNSVAFAKERCSLTEEQILLLPALYRKTKIQTRGSVLLEEGETQSFFPPALNAGDRGPDTAQRMERFAKEAPALALAASQRAFQEADLPPSEFGQLITVSCTGFMAPGIDTFLIKSLGLPAGIGRTHVGFMGCHGALNGLRVASAFLKANPETPILISSVELCSLHFYYGWDPEKMVANALFADGAASLILNASPASEKNWQLAASGSWIFPESEDKMSWHIGNHGFEMTLSSSVPSLIAEQLKPWLEKWLAENHLALKDIHSWGIHPGGPKIVQEVVRSLDLPESASAISEEILSQYGNMSSATLLFILQQLRERKAPRPCVLLGFGPGLAVEAALFI